MTSLRLATRATRRVAGALAAVSVGVLAMGIGEGSATAAPPRLTPDGVTAILVDPYFGCEVADAWANLNTNWSKYGSIPLSISTSGRLCHGTFTLSDLEASGADSVILDSTAAFYTLTPDEIQALQAYLQQGHTLLGEDTIFQWNTKHSNNGLAPLFGLVEQSTWYKNGLGGKSPHYKLQEQDPDAAVLLRDVANPYVSNLYGQGQKPANKSWVAEDLDGARYIARTHNQGNAITVYDGPSYTAIYISSQAAFYNNSTPDDLQFLYNAIIYPLQG